MRFWLKAIVGLVVAFVLNGVVTVGFQQAVGQELFANPHPYEWPLILAPLIALPLGAWLVVYLRPLPKDDSAPMVAA